MLTLPAEATNNKDKISIKPIILIDFVDLGYQVASRNFLLITDSGSDGVVTGTDTFTSATALFVTDDTGRLNDVIYIEDKDTEYTISSTNSDTAVTVSGSPENDTGLYWESRRYFLDFLKKDDGIETSFSLGELINDVSPVSDLTINLTDWRSTLRSNLVGSSPDLTDSEVKVYIKFDATDNDYDNILQIYYGKITDYKINRDIMTVNIKNHNPVSGDYPENLLKDENSQTAADDDVVKPLQYGDFLWDYDLRYWADAAGQGSLAICPAHLASSSTDAEWTIFVADHEMNTMIGTADQTWVVNAATDLPTLFTYRNGELCFLQVGTWETTGIYNTSTDCYMIPNTPIKAYIMRPLLEQGSENEVAFWQYTVDGKAATSIAVEGDEDVLHIKTCNFDNLAGMTLNNSSDDVNVFVYLGTVTGTDFFSIDYSDTGTPWSSGLTSIGSAHSDTIRMFSLDSITISKLEDLNTLEIRVKTSNISRSCEIKNIVVMPRIEDVNSREAIIDDKYFHLRCKGREYSGTWGSRKTAGNLIDNPIDAIESIFRDEFGVTNLDTASFDALHTEFDTNAIVPHISIFKQKKWKDLLEDLCQGLQVSLIATLTNSWRIVAPDSSLMMFASSGTDSPAAQDIFTDTDVISSGTYTNHPILKGSFRLSRSSVNNIYPKVTLNYKHIVDTYLESVSIGSGGLIKFIDTYSIGNQTSATALATIMQEWWGNQKYIATFRTFYNAIAHEGGDCINIRHSDLNDDMLDKTVNTQKWMIIDIKPTWHPNQIEITAIELRDPIMPI